jgi:hypothetical protein
MSCTLRGWSPCPLLDTNVEPRTALVLIHCNMHRPIRRDKAIQEMYFFCSDHLINANDFCMLRLRVGPELFRLASHVWQATPEAELAREAEREARSEMPEERSGRWNTPGKSSTSGLW